MTKVELLREINKTLNKINSTDDKLEKLFIDHYELTPLYIALGKLVTKELL